MKKLTDYTTLSQKKFWALVGKEGQACQDQFNELWDKADELPLTQAEAVECLDALFIYSHKRIREHSSTLAKVYPTKQLTKNRLAKVEHLFWVDHFTAGISRWSTLSWFSAAKREKKNGKIGYAGASTHFIQGYHEAPFYIIPLMHGAWHEPNRNRDGISIEMVNAGALKQNKEGKWCYWARQLPQPLVSELPPVLLDKPYRGAKVMQPFTLDQIRNNIKLKRVVITALGTYLEPCRMSQHTDWRKGKTDMGVLWPFEECNSAAYAREPLAELDFIQRDDYISLLDEKGAIWDEVAGWDTHDESDNPEYGELTPTHDQDDDDEADSFMDTDDVQRALVKKGYAIQIDGIPGPKTRTAVRRFQQDWNKKHPQDQIKADGIPGPQTCDRLRK